MKTFSPKPSDITRQWLLVDATDLVLGRVAADVARLLRGKHKPIFAPHMDVGDFVIVINASKVRLTGKKLQQKEMIRHTGYPGGLKRVSYERLMVTRPSRAIEEAVKGMLPHNRLGRAMSKKLKVYDGAEHPHVSQNPQPWIKQELTR